MTWIASAAATWVCGSESSSTCGPHDQPHSPFEQPIIGPASDGIVPGTGPEDNGGEGTRAESSGGASETPT